MTPTVRGAARRTGKTGHEVPPECVPHVDDLVTEDGAPVDRIFTEKQYRLLTNCLNSSWSGPGQGRPFLVLANVGWFYKYKDPPLVPDCLLSLDVACPKNLHEKAGHSYFQWLTGKPPDVVIEIVSDKRAQEDSVKMEQYARLKVSYYAIFDPDNILRGGVLRVFELYRGRFQPLDPRCLGEVGLGLTLWHGPFEGHEDTWLRWCDCDGKLLATPDENTLEEKRRADEAARQAETATRQADEAARQAETATRQAEKATRRARKDRRARADAERQAQQAAARVRELEQSLRRLQGKDKANGR